MPEIQTLPEIRAAIVYALEMLGDMTSEEFARGADRGLRDRLAQALGFADYEGFLNALVLTP